MADPNWLLATCAQSAAALVAIIGGFLISRIITLSSERNGIITRLSEVKNELDCKEIELEKINRKIIESDAEDFIEESLEEIIHRGGDITIDDLVEEHKKSGLSRNDLQPYFDRIIDFTKQAYNQIKEQIDRTNESDEEFPEEFSEFKKLIEIPEGAERVYKGVFDYFSELRERVNKEMMSRYGLPTYSHLNYKMPTITSPIISVAESQSYNQLVRDRRLLENECLRIEGQYNELYNRLLSLGKPKGIHWGIFALSYFSLVGIVYPITLIPISVKEFSLFHRFSVVVLFASGLLMVLLYLIISLRQLTENIDNIPPRKDVDES